MAGKYLKARKLAKEMEEKAKKTAEKKKEVEKGLEEAVNLLEMSEDIGTDVSGVEEIIDQGRDLLEEKEFDEAFEKVEEAVEELRKANASMVDELIGSVQNIHDMIGDEAKYEESLKKIENTKELKSEDDYNEALNTAKEALDLAQLELQGSLTDEFSNIESMIITVESREGDTEEVEKLVSEAKSSMDEDDFEKSYELVKEAKEKLSNELEEFIDDNLESLENQVQLIRNSGEETGDVEDMMSKIKTHSKNEEYDKALETINNVKDKLNEGMEEVVANKIDELADEINDTQDLGANIQELERKLSTIKDLQSEGQYSDAYEELENAFDEIEEAKFNIVLKTIAESRDNFIKAKEIGTDISEPMQMLNKARDSLKEGDHWGALEFAEEGRKKVKELVGEHEEIERSIKEYKEKLNELEKIGIDLEEAEERVGSAEEALADKDYDSAHQRLDDLDDYIGKVGYEKVMELVEELEMNILIAEEIGFEMDEYTEKLENAIANTKSGEYAEAGKIALEHTNDLQEMIDEELHNKLDNVRGIIEKIRGETTDEEDIADIEKVESVIAEGEEDLEGGHYKDAFEEFTKASEELKNWHVGEAEENITKATELIELIEDLEVEEIDIEDYKGKLEEAEMSLSSDEFSEAVSKANNIIKELNKKLRITAEDHFADAKMEVVKAKKAGVEIDKLRKKLIECKKKTRKEEYVDAIKISLKVESRAKKVREKRQSAYNLISNLSSDLTQKTKEGLIKNIKPAKEILLKAKDSFQSRDYTQAETLAEQARDKIKELEGQGRYKKDIKNIEKIISKADNLGVETEDFKNRLDEASDAAKDGDFKRSKEILDGTREDLHEDMREHVRPKLSKAKNILNSAKEIGIDVSEPEELWDEAQTLLEDGKYKDAIENINECQRKIDDIRNKSKKAAKEVKRAKDRIEEAKDLHADVDKSQEIVNNALESLKEDRYEKAIKEAQSALQNIEEAEKQRVDKILSNFKRKISEAKKEGVNTALADNLMKRAEKAMGNGKYKESINLGMQSEGELERIELQQDIAKRSISTTNKKLKDAKERGIKVKEPENLLDQAKKAYKGGFYVKAFDNAVKSGDKLNQYVKTYDETDEILNFVEKVVDNAEKLGIDVDDIQNDLKDVKRTFENGRYEKAYSGATRLEKSLSDLERSISEKVEDLENKVDSIADRGGDVEEAQDKLKKAKATFNVGGLLEAFELISEVREDIGEEDRDKFEEYRDETINLIEKAKKFGASVGDAQNIIEQARELEGADIKEAKEKAKEALDKVEESLEPYSPNIEVELEGKIRPDTWNKVEIKLKNTGKGVAKEPKLEFDGAKSKEFELPTMLKGGEDIEVKTEIKPVDDLVTIRASGTRIFDEKEMDCEIEIEPSRGEFVVKKAQEEGKCNICSGKIKKGLEIIECECGERYHRPCGEREGKCPECGTVFKKEEKKKEKKKKTSKRVALKI